MAWGFTTDGQRVLLDVSLGQRERLEDWLELGRGLLRRGLRSPLLVVSDGAPGLVRAVTELWPDADRQRHNVHRLERSLEEVRRRTKVIGRFPGETSCLTIAWAVMDLVIAGGKGLGLDRLERHAIATIAAGWMDRPAAELVA